MTDPVAPPERAVGPRIPERAEGESKGPVLELEDAALRVRGRTLFAGLDLQVHPGELIAILGPNGAGKTSLFRAILGLERLATGRVRVLGRPAQRGDHRIGYVPQQRVWGRGTPMIGRDLVTLGRTGARWGLPVTSREDREAVARAIWAVRAESLAARPMGDLSGGEQQRLRIAQAIVDEPSLLLLDEPLSSLDLGNQAEIIGLADRERERGAAVLFIAHDINPVLGHVDRVLYLAHGRHRLGTPGEVLTTESLTDLYGTRVDVLRFPDPATGVDRVFVAGAGNGHEHHLEQHADEVDRLERSE
ncbi:MAG TPA: ABC transporter ATP-binding protein [Microbacteriaceae bacterium]|nr:ABC transporter ATP-binding protein [Microbacteriaceae bacterium]